MLFLGIICTEGELWKDQRKFIHACLRQFGAAKVSPKRNQIEEMIRLEVQELVEVYGYFEMIGTQMVIAYYSSYVKIHLENRTNSCFPFSKPFFFLLAYISLNNWLP